MTGNSRQMGLLKLRGRAGQPDFCYQGKDVSLVPIKIWRNQMNLSYLWNDEHAQDIAEYAVMLAVILIIVVGTVRLIGSNANNAFSNVASSLQ